MSKWTAEYPTQSGYYWIRNYNVKGYYSEHTALGPTIVEVDSDLDFYFLGEDIVHYKRNVLSAEWYGTIGPPQDQDENDGS